MILRRQQEDILKTKEKIKRGAKAGHLERASKDSREIRGVFT